jgi:micrococcal nuclease
MTGLYRYRVLYADVVDGDTVDLTLDVGFRHTMRDRFRLYGPDPDGRMGLNAFELNSPEGRLAKAFLQRALAAAIAGHTVVARTVRDRREKFGRWLVVLLAVDDAKGEVVANLNDELVKAGHAVLKAY